MKCTCLNTMNNRMAKMCFIVKCVFLSLAARTHTVCVDDKQTEDDEENTATTTKSQQQPYPKTFIHPAKIYVFVCIKCGFQVRQHHNFHNAATAPKNVDSVLHSNLLPSPVCSQRSTLYNVYTSCVRFYFAR